MRYLSRMFAAAVIASASLVAVNGPAQADIGFPRPCMRMIGVQPASDWEGSLGSSEYKEFRIAVRSKGCMAAGSVRFYSVGDTAEQYSHFLGNYATHDLWPASGTLDFAYGDGGDKTIVVLVRADLIDEPDKHESFEVLLSNPSASITLPCTTVSHLIWDDDPTQTVLAKPGYYCPQ